MEIKKAQKNAENAEIFHCQKCDFYGHKKSDYVRHLSTRKHILSHNGNDLEINGNKKAQKNAASYFCNCGKYYKNSSGLWKHKKICILFLEKEKKEKKEHKQDKEFKEDKQDKENNLVSSHTEITPELILCVLQQNKELQNLVLEQNKTITELAKTNHSNNINSHNINSNNTSFNLQFFLNETCKNAMNIMDFVDSLKLQLGDLENMGQIGFVSGISNIIVKNLKNLDVTQRPVHCTDAKREVIYIKDENKWEKEGQENVKLRKAIKRVAYKNSKMLSEFRKEHPDCGKSDSKYADQYNKLVIEAMGGKGDNDNEKENQIIKNIAREVVIQK
jgi:hypothetical protein